MRKPISVTLSHDNLLWLKGQAALSRKGSVSDLLDRLVADARGGGWVDPAAVRSVTGSIDIADDDPDLDTADAYIRGLFATSARQPLLVRERPPATKGSRKGRGRG